MYTSAQQITCGTLRRMPVVCGLPAPRWGQPRHLSPI